MESILSKELLGYKIKDIAKCVVILAVTKIVLRNIWWRYRASQVRAKGKRAFQERNSRIYNFPEVNAQKEAMILELSVTQMREKLNCGEITAVDCVSVLGRRCYSIGRQMGYSADERFDEAILEAYQKDAETEDARKNGKLVDLPLLHGIPISVKEMFEVKGMMLTVGCDFLVDQVISDDCPTIKILKDAGAIILVKGNMPQIALSYHSSNRLWGTALNPYDKTRSCGGSTGGDAGLVSTRCVPLGIGTDLGGSMRVPCHFTGLRGFKYTSQRISIIGLRGILQDNFSQLPARIRPTSGPVANSMDDLILASKVMLHPLADKYDPFVAPMPFRQELFEKGYRGTLKIGYLESLSSVPAGAAAQRAVRLSVEKLKEIGHELVPFEFSQQEIQDYKDVMYGLAGNLTMMPTLKRLAMNFEWPMPQYEAYQMLLFSGKIKRSLFNLLFYLTGNMRLLKSLRCVRVLSKEELEVLMKKQIALYLSMKSKWEALGIDALVMPTYPIPAFKCENSKDLGGFLEYNLIWSIVHYPSGVIPVTEVLASEETYEDQYNDAQTKAIQKDIVGTAGLPVSVQIVTRKWEDELCLGVMKALDDKIQFKKAPVI